MTAKSFVCFFNLILYLEMSIEFCRTVLMAMRMGAKHREHEKKIIKSTKELVLYVEATQNSFSSCCIGENSIFKNIV